MLLAELVAYLREQAPDGPGKPHHRAVGRDDSAAHAPHLDLRVVDVDRGGGEHDPVRAGRVRRAAELSPFSPEVRKHLGEVLVKQGKLAEAAEQWERALAFVFPDRPALEKRLGELRVRIAREQTRQVQEEPAPASAAPDDDEEQP